MDILFSRKNPVRELRENKTARIISRYTVTESGSIKSPFTIHLVMHKTSIKQTPV